MGHTITKNATGTTECAVTVLAHIVHEILSNGGNDDTLLCLVWNGTKWANVEAHNVINMVCDKVKDLKLHLQAIDHDIVGALLLRAGGGHGSQVTRPWWHNHHENGKLDVPHIIKIHS